MTDKDYSLLRPFDEAAAKRGEAICFYREGEVLIMVAGPDDRIHKCPPGPERHNIRSATPLGFAQAVFESNAPARKLRDAA